MDAVVSEAASLLRGALAEDRRVVLGLVGPPGCGKTTLAEKLGRDLDELYPGRVAVLAQDAFHLDRAVLNHHGLDRLKGAPETFDARGFVSLLKRVHTEAAYRLYAPVFDRQQEHSLAAAAEIGPAVRLVIVEGNYLLLDVDPWQKVRDLCTEIWYLDLPDDVRQRRLIGRRIEHGMDETRAREWTLGSDERNAELVAQTRAHADRVLIRPDD